MTSTEIRHAVEWACLMEATAQKPGNVHPKASFPDLDYTDFVRAGLAAGEPLSRAADVGVGRAIFLAVSATLKQARSNVNLGIILLLAPLCAAAARLGPAPVRRELRAHLVRVLGSLTVDDANLAFEAIRLAKPGGLGSAPEQDVLKPATTTLADAMRLAAHRDAVARQYATSYEGVFSGVDLLNRALAHGYDWESAVIFCHLGLMSLSPDTLILRKLGEEVALESRWRAARVIDAFWADRKSCGEEWRKELAALDAWLRADGNKRNPGASADLTAASLFAANITGVFPSRHARPSAPPLPCQPFPT